jgi:hypothetical protein
LVESLQAYIIQREIAATGDILATAKPPRPRVVSHFIKEP